MSYLKYLLEVPQNFESRSEQLCIELTEVTVVIYLQNRTTRKTNAMDMKYYIPFSKLWQIDGRSFKLFCTNYRTT